MTTSSATRTLRESAASAQDTITRGLDLLEAKLAAAGLDADAMDSGRRELRALAERLGRIARAAAPLGVEVAQRVAESARPLRDDLVARLGQLHPMGAELVRNAANAAAPLGNQMAKSAAGKAAGAAARRVAGTAGAAAAGGLRAAARHRAGLVTTVATVAGIAAIGLLVRRRAQANGAVAGAEGPVAASVTVNRPQGEVYRFWRDLANLPRFMDRIAEVRETGERRSHWIAEGPGGATLEWDAEITTDVRDECIAWRSLDGADVDSEGSVRFAPAAGGRGTVVRVELSYRPPGGAAGTLVARLFGQAPEQQLRGDLRRLAQLLEAGEVTTNRRRAS